MDRLVEGFGKGLIPEDRIRARMTALQEERERLQSAVAAAEGELRRLQGDRRAEESPSAFAERLRGAPGPSTTRAGGMSCGSWCVRWSCTATAW